MIALLIITAVCSEGNYVQMENWHEFKVDIPKDMINQDIIVTLNKLYTVQPLLLLAKYETFPVFNYSNSTNSWNVDADFFDFQSWVSKDSISCKIKITNVTFLELYIGIYKNSPKEISYSLSISQSSPDSCLRTCKKNSECNSSICECKGFNLIGDDCGTFAETISQDKKNYLRLNTEEWKFFRISSSKKELTLSISTETSNFHIFTFNSDLPNNLPGMLSNNFSAFIDGPQNIRLKKDSKKFWLISVYCTNYQYCNATLELESSSSSDSPLATIILASVVSSIFVCTFLPIILRHFRFCRRSNVRSTAKVGNKQKKNDLDKIFPKYKFMSTRESVNCIICLDIICQDSYARKLSCNHIYHANCIDEWNAAKGYCPLCKKSISLNEITAIRDD